MKTYLKVIVLFYSLLSLSCSYSPIFNRSHLNDNVNITERRRTIIISSKSESVSNTGIIFYPGGLVDSHVYNELLSNFVSRTGILTIVVKMPGNLAVLDINAAQGIMSDYINIDNWVIVGHSLGGSMAASTVKSNPNSFKGLIFMDSYPADGDSLKNWSGAILSLYSSIEKINDTQRMNQTLSLLPPATWLNQDNNKYPDKLTNYTVIHQIDGGSHSYFGSYGPQDGDFTPTISRKDFHLEVLDYMVEFFLINGWE